MVVISRYFDRFTISNAGIACYRQCYPEPPTDEVKKKKLENLTRGKYNGYLSAKTKLKSKRYITNWIASVENYFRLKPKFKDKANIQFNLITLTLPAIQNHEDEEIKTRALKPFLEQLHRKFKVENHFWCAETQKNGSIHFHIIVDKFIDHQQIRELWNGYMSDLGYIDDYRHGQEEFHKNGFRFRAHLSAKWSFGAQVEAYMQGIKSNWSSPNSTDIHRLKKINNVAAYLTKYLTKGDSNRPISGRLWGCSDSLRNIKPINLPLSNRMKQVIMQLADEDGSRTFHTDFSWSLWRFDRDKVHNEYPTLSQILKNFNRHCVRVLYPRLLQRDFFDTLAPPIIQAKLELVPVYR